MALRSLIRNGARRHGHSISPASQPHQVRQAFPQFAEQWSFILRFKHTIAQENCAQCGSFLSQTNPRAVFHAKQALAQADSGIRASFHARQTFAQTSSAIRVGSHELHCRHLLAQPSFGIGASFHAKQAISQASTAVRVESHETHCRRLLAQPSSGIRAWFHATKSPCHGSSRSFHNCTMEAASKNTVLPSKHRYAAILQHMNPFKSISTDSIVKNLKLSPNAVVKNLSISTDSIVKNLKLSPNAVKQPIDGIKKVATRYKEAAGLQVEAFWKRNVMILVGAAGILSCFLLWRIMYGVANIFVSFSEGMAKFGFLAMAAATVAFTAMALRARYTINPDRVYRIVMRMLNTSAAALEVLGPPLTGTDLRAYVMSSGGLKLKNFKPRFGSRRCFLIFPIQGSERKGLVSAEVKKKKGKYDFKLLAIDVAIPGAEQRIFLVGDETEYKVGGGLIGQLRDPILKVMAAQEEFDAQDEKEEAEEERTVQEMKEEEARRKEEIVRLERES